MNVDPTGSAVCASVDPDLWFPDDNKLSTVYAAKVAAAKAMCMECSLLAACREYALEAAEPYGVWGGLSERDRGIVLTRGPAATRASVLQAVEHAASLEVRELLEVWETRAA